MKLFSLFKNRSNKIEGDTVDLLEEHRDTASMTNHYVTSIFYDIYLHHENIRVGNCDLRIGHNQELYYAGNIGYHINLPYRGHHYAYHAGRMLLRIAEDKGMHELYITCSPENEASRKTIEQLGGVYIETVPVPNDHWLYQRGETVKRIYHYDLGGHAL